MTGHLTQCATAIGKACDCAADSHRTVTQAQADRIPSPDELRKMREAMGLSQPELAEALGFGPINGPDIIRAWEAGERSGKTFTPKLPTLLAMRYLEAMHNVITTIDAEADDDEAWDRLSAAIHAMRRAIPEFMR